MKIFLDSNVIVSAFATRGLCADVLDIVLDEHELMLAEIVLEETERALRTKLRASDSAVALALHPLRRHPVHPTAPPPEESPLSNPDDAQILASALSVGAEVLVTGDREILDARDRIQGILIKSPREFWEIVRGKPDER